jgi:WD40 repeat protein
MMKQAKSGKQKLWKKQEEIQEIRYSPDGTLLAVASRDNCIYIFDVHREYRRIGVCKGHSSFVGCVTLFVIHHIYFIQVTHIDWSLDSSVLMSTDGAYEILYWNAATRKQVNSTSVC